MLLNQILLYISFLSSVKVSKMHPFDVVWKWVSCVDSLWRLIVSHEIYEINWMCVEQEEMKMKTYFCWSEIIRWELSIKVNRKKAMWLFLLLYFMAYDNLKGALIVYACSLGIL